MGPHEAQKVPASVERFVKQLVITLKAVVLYPPASSIPKENAAEAIAMLGRFLQNRAEMRLTVLKDGLAYDGTVVYEGQPAYESFAREFYNRGIAEIRFHSGVEPADMTAFLGLLGANPAELASLGGVENRMWELGIDTITVKMAAARIVDADGDFDVEEGEEWPPDVTRIDEIVAAALGGRPRDQRLLVRVITDEDVVKRYMRETLTQRGDDPNAALRGLKLAELARAASQAGPDVRGAGYHAIAEALGALDPELRHRMLVERVLPEARTDENIAAVVRHMDIDQVCRWLVEGLDVGEFSIDGLARAIRNLAMISLAERDTVMDAAGAAMRGSGLGEEVVDSVMETVSPSVLRVTGDAGSTAQEQPVDSILQLVDLAPNAVATRFDDDSDFVRLQEESRRGINDGDVVAALVTLVSVDSHGDQFGPIMSLLEDTLELTVDRGDYQVAAEAVEALIDAADDAELTANRRQRLVDAVSRLAAPAEMREIARAMRVYAPGSAEYAACERIITALEVRAVHPLLETLAEEQDMAARKALVDTISRLAGDYVDELGEHLNDSRWFFVRNVVAILGRTKDPQIIQYLNRTLRHSDARVRRETIRALAGVHHSLATEMLVAALDDQDAQNVQLAARYLGLAEAKLATAALRRVALGDGSGNRETGPRVEAIEALGRLRDADSLPVLEELAGRRSVLRGSRTRELRVAAEHAIDAIRTPSGGGADDE